MVCDAVGRTGDPHVWAIGDVAAWTLGTCECKRVEHWSNAGDQAKILAGALTGTGDPNAPTQVPYFWSDQYGLKIRRWARCRPPTTSTSSRTTAASSVVYYSRDGVLTAVVGAGSPAR